jgi:hypothetical protein
MGSRQAKLKILLLVGRWPAKLFFKKGRLMGKTILRSDNEWVIAGYIHSSYLITGREII